MGRLQAGRDRLPRARLALLAAGCTLALSAPSAGAAPHELLYSFGPDGNEASSFSQLRPLAFDTAARRLYARDVGVKRIYGFDVAGGPPFAPLAAPWPIEYLGSDPSPSGLGVDSSDKPSAGTVYFNIGTAGNRMMNCYTAAGAPVTGCPFAITQSNGGEVAVDSAGRVWSGENPGGGGTLRVYSPDGNLLAELDARMGGQGLAFDTNDDLYISNSSEVRKLDAASDYNEATTIYKAVVPNTMGPRALAVDRRSHHLFVARADDRVDEYDSEGNLIGFFGEGIAGAEYLGIAVDPADHRVYVADGGSGGNQKIHVFSAGDPVPSLSLGEPAPLESTSATLQGTVDPEGLGLNECRFEWVDEAAYRVGGFGDLGSGGSAACEGALPPDSEEHPVSAAIEGLAPATTYRYRIVASAPGAANSFADTFTTPGPPGVETTGAQLPSPQGAVLGGRVNPHGAPTSYHFQYTDQASFAASGFNGARETPASELSADEVQQFELSGTATLSFGGESTALLPVDASAKEVQGALEGLTGIGAGEVSVAGGRSYSRSPSRYTATFKGALGGKDVPPILIDGTKLAETPVPGGVGSEVKLVAARIGELSPDTSYRYRLVAESPDGEAVGETLSLKTHAGELGNASFPHPPGNDRAYEQVSIPDSGGNPAQFALAFAGDGNRAIYQVSGGTPVSGSGTFLSQLLAERPAGEHPSEGWRQVNLTPRSLFNPDGPDWSFFPSADLSRFAAYNFNGLGEKEGEVQNLWRITPPGGPYELLHSALSERSSGFFEASADAGRVLNIVEEDLDPEHPAPSGLHLYDVSAGSPQLLDLLPDESVPACGVSSRALTDPFGDRIYSFQGTDPRPRRWVSADGELAFFPSKGNSCSGPVSLYLREIGGGVSKEVAGAPLSGQQCSAAFIRSTAEAAFIWTQSRLAADDTEPPPGSCASGGGNTRDGDVYRYDLGDGELSCVTCAVSGVDADVRIRASATNPAFISPLASVGVAANGGAVYFESPNRLLAGAASRGIYRVDVGGGELDYVAPGEAAVGDALGTAAAVSADGGVLVFRSDDPRLDPQGGTTNGGFAQYYRYEQADRSLACVSCPADGSAPRGEPVGFANTGDIGGVSAPSTFNGSPLSADGGVFAFDTPTALAGADQNTAPQGKNAQQGQDVYEWREGRALLISDGLQAWSGGGQLGAALGAPEPAAVSPSGRDVFFFEAAQLTADALDPYKRLYDARLGGGLLLPTQAAECKLEVCQGTPAGAPAPSAPGTSSFQGAGNLSGGRSCGALARRAAKLSRRAKRLRRAAKRSKARARGQALRRRATRTAKRAKKLSAKAKRCRRAGRRAGR